MGTFLRREDLVYNHTAGVHSARAYDCRLKPKDLRMPDARDFSVETTFAYPNTLRGSAGTSSQG